MTEQEAREKKRPGVKVVRFLRPGDEAEHAKEVEAVKILTRAGHFPLPKKKDLR